MERRQRVGGLRERGREQARGTPSGARAGTNQPQRCFSVVRPERVRLRGAAALTRNGMPGFPNRALKGRAPDSRYQGESSVPEDCPQGTPEVPRMEQVSVSSGDSVSEPEAETLWRPGKPRRTTGHVTSSSSRTRRWCSTWPRRSSATAGALRAGRPRLVRPDRARRGRRPLRSRARARRSSSTPGHASTARSSTSCAARTGRRARSGATAARSSRRATPSTRRKAASRPRPSWPTRSGRGRRAARAPRRARRAPTCLAQSPRASWDESSTSEIGDTIEAGGVDNPEPAVLDGERAPIVREAVPRCPSGSAGARPHRLRADPGRRDRPRCRRVRVPRSRRSSRVSAASSSPRCQYDRAAVAA